MTYIAKRSPILAFAGTRAIIENAFVPPMAMSPAYLVQPPVLALKHYSKYPVVAIRQASAPKTGGAWVFTERDRETDREETSNLYANRLDL
jgi:hypothetical protein